MSLTRADLEQGLMQRLFRDATVSLGYRLLSDQELAASLDSTLKAYPGEGDPWVFGYGSLIWNPLLEHVERQCAILRGYHRRFCLWSKTGRGTPERPGLVLGLDRGGCCRGVAYRIDAKKVRDEFTLLWRREMLSDSYVPRWVTIRAGEREVCALTFIINRVHPNYARKIDMEELVDALATASGRLGSSRDYLCQTVEGLEASGITDSLLTELRARVSAVAALEFPVGSDEA
jgi:glutathione-specific gamma-glutamylcyclotransferase